MFGLFAKKPPQNPAQQAITGNFNLTAQLGASGRTIQFAGYVYDGESLESVQARVDLFRSIIDREKTLAEIPELEAKREQMLKGLQQARDVLTELETRRKNGERLSSQELLNVNNMRTNIKKVSDEIEKGTQAIAEARKRVGAAG